MKYRKLHTYLIYAYVYWNYVTKMSLLVERIF